MTFCVGVPCRGLGALVELLGQVLCCRYPYPVKPRLMLPCTSCTVALCAKVVCVLSSPGPGVANFLMASLVLQGYCCMVRVSLCVPVASFWCRADSFVWWLHKPTKAWLVLAMLVPAAADSSDALQKERVQHSVQQARETRPRQASQALCCRHDVSWAVQHGCVAARLLVGQAASVGQDGDSAATAGAVQ